MEGEREGERERESKKSARVKETESALVVACLPLVEPLAELRMNPQLEERQSQISLGATSKGSQPWD